MRTVHHRRFLLHRLFEYFDPTGIRFLIFRTPLPFTCRSFEKCWTCCRPRTNLIYKLRSVGRRNLAPGRARPTAGFSARTSLKPAGVPGLALSAGPRTGFTASSAWKGYTRMSSGMATAIRRTLSAQSSARPQRGTAALRRGRTTRLLNSRAARSDGNG
jgi:hypothetical protein